MDFQTFNWLPHPARVGKLFVGTNPGSALIAKKIEDQELSVINLLGPAPYVVPVLGQTQIDQTLCFVMPTLQPLREKLPLQTPTEVARFIQLLVAAIFQLGTSGVLHHDLKMSNILYDQSQDRPVLCDFDMSLLFDPSLEGNRQIIPCCPYISSKNKRIQHSLIPDQECSTAVDIYQLGLVICEIWKPNAGPEFIWTLKRNLCCHDSLAQYLATLEQDFEEPDWLLVDLILKMVDDNPQTRLTAEIALQHPYFKFWKEQDSIN